MIAGIDIGGTAIKGVLIDIKGNLLGKGHVATPAAARDIEGAVLALVETMATAASLSKIDLRALGIGSAGSIDKKRGAIITSPNIPGLSGHALGRNLGRATGLPVFLENDATVALMGAWWKECGNRFNNWILLTLGTGIGGGAVIDNKIYTGRSGNAMEVGHMTIDHRGRPCSCGSRGCLERYASATALVEHARSLLAENPRSRLHRAMELEPLSAKMIHEAALKRDRVALTAMNETATYLGYGIAGLINLFNPDAVVLAGGLSQAHAMLLPVVRSVVGQRALRGLHEKVKFLAVKNHDIIPALGAARIALDSLNKNS
jgi:glucokinase